MFRVLFKRPKTDMLKRRPCRLCRLSVIFFYCLYINFVVKFFAVAIWLWSAICFKITTRYTCGFFPHILAIIPATRYTCVFCHVYLRFIPKYMTIFLQTRIYMRTKNPYICVTNKHVVYAVAESRHIRGTELYRQQKTPSCTMELKSNFSLNQAWPQWPR